jgi:energy-coupling factor transport system ATP-binding protein
MGKVMSLKLENVSYLYGAGTSTETAALKNINLEIEKGEFVAIIGHTGSGKSTLIQHFNGLEKASSGNVYYNGKNVNDKDFDLKELRCKVGLVFQYPEHQLFEESVLKDVCFGPKNQGLSKEKAIERAKEALELVGVREELYDSSPFELSGGQKRRVAIAGVLAMQPDILILDEPTAGLDPEGRDKILHQVKLLHEKKKIGVILVSHSMEDVANYAERIIVMNQGKIMYDDTPHKVFSHYQELEKIGLAAPQITYIMHQLKDDGLDVDENIINLEDAKKSILKSLGK